MRTFRKGFRIIVSVVMLIILLVAGYNISMKYIYPLEYRDIVQRYCGEYNVDMATVFAVIKCESNFDETAVSNKNAVGLMQLTEETFNDVKKMLDDQDVEFSDSAQDANINIKYGTKYLEYLSEYFDGDKLAVLAAYNAGMGNVNKWLGDDGKLDLDEILFPETKIYVQNVLKSEQKYKTLLK